MLHHYALLPAAGTGSRFGAGTPKQYLDLAGRPMIHHAIETLCACDRMDAVYVVLSPDDARWSSYDWSAFAPKLRAVFCGGATRGQSVINGLQAMERFIGKEDWILVHDAARPCLTSSMLDSLIDAIDDDPVGGLLAVPVADTLKQADFEERAIATRSRDGLWQAQTPQMFRYGLLREALKNLVGTDEACAVEAAGLRPRLVRADAGNLKVTFPEDLRLAERLIQGRKKWSG
ncbi:MAG: 2-C-methyl-D-erythritol 4-phosphate cytidylyltransferase [Candidatus Accumulibacter sp.]|jgi:2-C-methyl-D-erythritol 4-phosphate cytidylyltransferase|nr:2-C-methyl-D-erythritol 4-phosphate cytidylyltransferase [Accumulibacter sp.]